jgi:hypothetical protein
MGRYTVVSVMAFLCHASGALLRPLALILFSITIGATVGCASATAPPTPIRTIDAVAGDSGLNPSPSPLAHLDAPPSPSPVARDALVRMAMDDAAQRAGAAPSDVAVLRVEPREWPDRSLGCPRPGVGYAQVLTPGLLIVVQVGGQQLEYHTDEGHVIPCSP